MRASGCLVASAALVLALAAAPAGAQEGGTTTTTASTVRPIPVTGGGGAPAPANSAPGLASTGVAADALVPFAFGLIALGSALEAASRRRRVALRSA